MGLLVALVSDEREATLGDELGVGDDGGGKSLGLGELGPELVRGEGWGEVEEDETRPGESVRELVAAGEGAYMVVRGG